MAAKKELVEIKPLEIKRIELTIVGTTPLIVHNFDEKARRQILDAQQGKAVPKKNRPKKVPVNDFMRSMYWLTEQPEDGEGDEEAEANFRAAMDAGAKFGFRADGIKASIISGAYRSGFTKDKVSVQGAFHLHGATDASTWELAEIVGSDPVMREDMVRVGQGTADIRYRAQYDEWKIPLVMEYNASGLYSLDQIFTFINAGGFMVGIGEWRVEKGGMNGSYRLDA